MMNIKHKLSIFAVGLLLAACSGESVLDTPSTDSETPSQEEGARREVLLTLKNSLVLKASGARAAGDPIATEEENYIQTLDVYVFGAKEEAGPYTFQELHYFRDDATEVTMPGVNTYSFNLTPSAADNTTTGLLKLNKGLYVKLYCIANRTHLFQTDGAGTMTEFTGFKSLVQTAPGQDANVVTAGVPLETDFTKFHTNLINPAATNPTADDILTTPLPMTGAYTTPLDLTDFSSSARTQISFKLSRMVARFDIVNDASASKFTIEKISMGNGQNGAQFFPIRTLVTDAAKLISYPERTVSALTQVTPDVADPTKTNITKGAFYTWPSPKADGGYLMLKGKYAVNMTEQKEVSYKIPFEQVQNGIGSYIEVAYNHRYTIAITKADDYHLDFTLKVADWDDGEKVDEYEPENSFDRNAPIVLETDGGASTGAYVLDNGQISVLAKSGSKLAFKMGSNTKLQAELVFKQGSAEWIKVVEPVVTTNSVASRANSMDSLFQYKVDETLIDDRSKLLPVTIRLSNPASGVRKEIKVIATPGPEVAKTAPAEGAAVNYSSFNAATQTATIYNLAGQTLPLTVTAETRSNGAEPPVLKTGSTAALAAGVSWLKLDKTTSTDAEGKYVLTLSSVQTLPAETTVDFTSTASTEMTQIKVKLLNPKMTAPTINDFVLGTKNEVDMTGGTSGVPKVTMTGILNNSFTLKVTSPEGVTAEATGGATWLNVETGASADAANGMKTTVITVSIKDAAGMGTTIKSDGKFTIKNVLNTSETQIVEVKTKLPDAPVVSMPEAVGNPSSYDAATKTATVYNTIGQTITLVTDEACTVANTNATDWLTIVAGPATRHTLTVKATKTIGTTGVVTFTNAVTGSVTTVTVKLANPAITALIPADFTSTGGTCVMTTAAGSTNAKVTMKNVTSESAFTLKVTSVNGISVDTANTSSWLSVKKTLEEDVSGGGKKATITVAIVEGTDLSTAISNGKIVLKNAIEGGGDMTIDVVTTV